MQAGITTDTSSFQSKEKMNNRPSDSFELSYQQDLTTMDQNTKHLIVSVLQFLYHGVTNMPIPSKQCFPYIALFRTGLCTVVNLSHTQHAPRNTMQFTHNTHTH